MKVRVAGSPPSTGHSSGLNPSGIGNEVIVRFDDGSMDSMFVHELEVQLADGRWVDLKSAFAARDVIPDNYNRHFREPRTALERQRGWYD